MYAALEIPIGTVDPSERAIGNRALQIRRKLGSTPLSRYFDCGTGVAGPNIASYQVALEVLTFVEEAAGSSALRTRVVARGKPLGNSSGWIECQTTGRLERQIAEEVMQRL